MDVAIAAGSSGKLNIGAAVGQAAVAPGTLNTSLVAFGAGTGVIVFNHTALNHTFAPAVSGAGSVRVEAGTTILTAANTYTGATSVNAGTLQAGAQDAFAPASAFTVASGATLALNSFDQSIGSLAGAGHVTLGLATLTGGGNNASTIFSGVMSGNGGLAKIGTGVFALTGTNTYIGPTAVNDGTLAVNGSIASSSLTTVNSGGTLGGNGTVGNTAINGGALAPGNSIGLLTVQGSLTLTAASSYMVEVSPANADRTNVTATANLGGATVNASFAAGTYVAKRYTILSATGGLGGSTFGSVVNTNLPANFRSSLSYDANNAYLELALSFIAPPNSGLNSNQKNVGDALVNFFNTNGGISLAFGGLTPSGLPRSLARPQRDRSRRRSTR